MKYSWSPSVRSMDIYGICMYVVWGGHARWTSLDTMKRYQRMCVCIVSSCIATINQLLIYVFTITIKMFYWKICIFIINRFRIYVLSLDNNKSFLIIEIWNLLYAAITCLGVDAFLWREPFEAKSSYKKFRSLVRSHVSLHQFAVPLKLYWPFHVRLRVK